MRKIGLLAAAAALMAMPALAQVQYEAAPQPLPRAERAPLAPAPRAPATYESQRTGVPAGRPVDLGPRSPGANAAFMGGGVILEGAPGAPAPAPQAITGQPGPDGVVRVY
jgi:hypothetical protein